MILQALYDYYQRKSTDPDSGLPPFGFEQKELPFIVEINNDGELIQIEDTRHQEGKKKVGQAFLVPQAVKKTSGVAANLLWDNTEYALGIPRTPKPGQKATTPTRLAEQHRAFIEKIRALPKPAADDAGIRAILRFFDTFSAEQISDVTLQEALATNPNISFRLNGDTGLICQRQDIINTLRERQAINSDEDETGICLITGEKNTISRLHPAIKGVWGAQSSGANIVAVNNKISGNINSGPTPAFASYHKQQGYNSPIGNIAAFAYTTALNHLLRKDSPQRLQVGDSSTVFWSEKPTDFETQVVDFFGEPAKDDPDADTDKVAELYRSIQHGRYVGDDVDTVFYVLGLAPNAARIAVRFWEITTVGRLAERIVQHFDDLRITHGSQQPEHLPLFRLLVATATQGKADNIPPNLAGDTMRAILTGSPYPQSLLAATVRRIRAEREVTYPRAAPIKACINRQIRYSNLQTEEELTVSLDKTNPNPGYRLGRLFATLEKIQEEASPGINATIRDRFYGAASSTPVSVFPNLIKLSKHHLSKLENPGRASNFEKLLAEIIGGIDDFPAHLSLADQGRFAIGYYHQRQDFFTKHETTKETAQGETA